MSSILCSTQRLLAFNDLTVSGYVDRNKLRPRNQLAQALQDFLAADLPLMPVVGESGAGKTSIAALLSSGMGLQHGLLLRGIHMRPGDATIAAQIERALTDGEYGTYGLNSLNLARLAQAGCDDTGAYRGRCR